MNARQPLPVLCRLDDHTCGACCWGEAVDRESLCVRLRRQTALFRRRFASTGQPGRFGLLLHEVLARGGLDLIMGLLLLIPGVNIWLRAWLGRRLVCAFLGFEDEGQQRIGCLLHPSRWQGLEVRPQAAFALLPGFGCGSPSYFCLAAHRFARASWESHRLLLRQTAALDWYGYSLAVRNLSFGDSTPQTLPAHTGCRYGLSR